MENRTRKRLIKELLDEAEDVTGKVILSIVVCIVAAIIFAFIAFPVMCAERIVLIRPFDDKVIKVRISGKFGVPRKRASGGTTYPHTGMDFRLKRNTDLRASYAGTVIFAEDSRTGYGNLVKIDHGGGVVTYYAHLSRPDVKAGDKVKKGQLIGKVGSSGRTNGPHLHWEVRLNNRPRNPMVWLRAPRAKKKRTK